jgi:hypothetical protein
VSWSTTVDQLYYYCLDRSNEGNEGAKRVTRTTRKEEVKRAGCKQKRKIMASSGCDDGKQWKETVAAELLLSSANVATE